MKNRQWRLMRRPQGAFKPADFMLAEHPFEPLAEGQVRVALKFLSLDPTNRVWAREAAIVGNSSCASRGTRDDA